MLNKLPIVLYGSDHWDKVLNFESMVRYGLIGSEDVNLFHRCDSVDEVYDYITGELREHSMDSPGARLLLPPKSPRCRISPAQHRGIRR